MNLLVEDKRKNERLEAEVASCILHEGSLLCGTQTVNVSDGGVLLSSPVFLAKGLSVEVSIHLHDSDRYEKIKGKTLRIVPIHEGSRYAVAIEFDRVQHGLRDAVEADSPEQNVAVLPAIKRGRMASRVPSRSGRHLVLTS